jgi:hypothetical protein
MALPSSRHTAIRIAKSCSFPITKVLMAREPYLPENRTHRKERDFRLLRVKRAEAGVPLRPPRIWR